MRTSAEHLESPFLTGELLPTESGDRKPDVARLLRESPYAHISVAAQVVAPDESQHIPFLDDEERDAEEIEKLDHFEADNDGTGWSTRSSSSPMSAPQRAWVLDVNRSALERLFDATMRRRYLSEVEWSRVAFPGNTPKGEGVTDEIERQWRLADKLFSATTAVAPERRVPHSISYHDPVVVEVPGQAGHWLFGEARDAFVRMREAAAADGVILIIGSSWRSRKKQKNISRNQPNPKAAARGVSAHMYGLAVDLRMSVPGLRVAEANTRTREKMANLVSMYRSPVYKWMALRGGEFGWYPYRREPWHWEYNPPGFKARFEGSISEQIGRKPWTPSVGQEAGDEPLAREEECTDEAHNELVEPAAETAEFDSARLAVGDLHTEECEVAEAESEEKDVEHFFEEEIDEIDHLDQTAPTPQWFLAASEAPEFHSVDGASYVEDAPARAIERELLNSSEHEDEESETHWLSGDEIAYIEDESPLSREVIFQSGASLSVISGLPEGKDQEYWDPTASGNPLLDTGPVHKDKKLSASFTVRELTMSGGISADVARIDPKLVDVLQRLRDHVGRTIKIMSGYRSWKRNKKVYAGRKNGDGKPKEPKLSQHCGGRAVDIRIQGMTGLDIGRAAIDACGPRIGVGLGNTFAHIDVRGLAKAWNYEGVADSWVAEIKRHQRARLSSARPPAATGRSGSIPSIPEAVNPSVELTRFAQRVLNATEGERLAVDGAFGKLTRSAVERFRTRYGLGAGGVIDGPTKLALVQGALEEIAQQSMLSQRGVQDAATTQALSDFKARRDLGISPSLDTATLAAIEDALRQADSINFDARLPQATTRLSPARRSVEVSEPVVGSEPTIRLGTLKFSAHGWKSVTYPFTTSDLIWTARLVAGEAGARDDLENRAVVAALLNRFAMFTWSKYPTFHEFLRAYSTPLQPVLRNKDAARAHMNDMRFRKSGGTYEGTDIPRGQLQQHLDLQDALWGELPPVARSIAVEALAGRMPDTGIGLASEFASTWILYGRRVGKPNRSESGWIAYTERFKNDKGFRWIGPRPGLDQKRNAFFVRSIASAIPLGSVHVIAPNR